MRLETIAVVGAGAVGCYFGGMLARAGAGVTLIGRREHVEAVAQNGLEMDTLSFQEHVRAAATTEMSAAADADLILFSVKTLDTELAARQLAADLARRKVGAAPAIVLSLQNGVDNVERIRAAAGIEALPAVVYVAAAMPAPGCVKHSGRGDLVIGLPRAASQNGWLRGALEPVAQLFMKANVPCRISQNIEGELWAKLVWNCAGNAITALGRATYGQVARDDAARETMLSAAQEVMAVARAAGVELPPMDLAAAGLKLAQDLGAATSSTAQDLARGKRTEIDALNGYITRRGAELGVPTPVNGTLYALVKLLEENLPK